MVSVRKRNIQGRYNSVRHIQRRYLELPSLRVVSIVDSIVTGSIVDSIVDSIVTGSVPKIPKQPEQDSGYTSKNKIFAPS